MPRLFTTYPHVNYLLPLWLLMSLSFTPIHAQVRLTPPMPQGSSGVTQDYLITPDGQHVVYVAEQDLYNKHELYIVPIDSGAPRKLNGPMVGGISALSAEINLRLTPDGEQAVYFADQDTPQVTELYIVPLAGGTPRKLNGPLVPGGDVNQRYLGFSSVGPSIVYRAEQDTLDVLELYRVPLAGGTPIKLNDPLVPGGSVVGVSGNPKEEDIQISPDGQRVVYLAEQDTTKVELYSVSIEGGISVKLNKDLPPLGRVEGNTTNGKARQAFDITGDGASVVYLAEVQGNYMSDLFVVPITGSGSRQLNFTYAEIRSAGERAQNFVIAPDGETIFYRADDDSTWMDRMFRLSSVSAPIGGTSVHPSTDSAIGEIDSPFLVSPNSQYVVYSANVPDTSALVLYANGIRLSSSGMNIPQSLSTPSFKIDPTSRYVVFLARDAEFRDQLYCVPITGGTPIRLSNRDTDMSFLFSPDGEQVYFKAYESPTRRNLYRVSTTGDSTAVRLTQSVSDFSKIPDFALSEAGDQLVFRGQPRGSLFQHLYSVRVAESPTSTQVVAVSSSFRLFPNPTHGQVRVDGLAGACTYALRDIQGRIILAGQCAEESFWMDLSDISAGTYFLQVEQGAGLSHQMLIKR